MHKKKRPGFCPAAAIIISYRFCYLRSALLLFQYDSIFVLRSQKILVLQGLECLQSAWPPEPPPVPPPPSVSSSSPSSPEPPPPDSPDPPESPPPEPPPPELLQLDWLLL